MYWNPFTSCSSLPAGIWDTDIWDLYPPWRKDQQAVKDFYGEFYAVGETMAEPAHGADGVRELNVGGSFPLPSGGSAPVTVRIPMHVMSAWCLALYDENCLVLSQLLEENPKLVIVNITDHFKRLAEKNRSNTSWKQRTALHVGARRGSALLVVQLMKMFQDTPGWTTWWTNCYGKKIEGYPIRAVLQTFLKELLLRKDEEYELDAFAMAVVNGNREIMRILGKSSLKSPMNPYNIISSEEAYDYRDERDNEEEMDMLKSITKTAIAGCQADFKTSYRKCMDFNFLPGDQYTFHFTFSSSLQELTEVTRIRDGIFRDILEKENEMGPTQVSPLKALCDLQDGQGRTPMHVATDEGTVDKLLCLIPHEHRYAASLQPLDGKGRTPIYRAATTNKSRSLEFLLADKFERDPQGYFIPESPSPSWNKLMKEMGIDIRASSSRNGFESFGQFIIVPQKEYLGLLLSTAILLKNKECVESLLGNDVYMKSHVDPDFSYDLMLENIQSDEKLCANPLQVAALVGDVPTARSLLKDDKRKSMDCKDKRSPEKRSAIHLAAAAGRYDILTLILRDEKYNHFAKDKKGNTPLHHALKPKLNVQINMMDKYSNFYHIQCSREVMRTKEDTEDKRENKHYAEKKACIELLLQIGFDISEVNNESELPSPELDAPHDFLTWWYERRTQEIIASEKTLKDAANYITITAVLIATFSYTGSFNSPLDPSTSNSPHNSVEGKLSLPIGHYSLQCAAFLFSVSSLVLALTIALPSPQQSMADELEGLKRQVIVAVMLLFPSILCLLANFALKVVSTLTATVTRKHHRFPVYILVGVGGLACLVIIPFFVIRLFRVFLYKNRRIKWLYKKALGM